MDNKKNDYSVITAEEWGGDYELIHQTIYRAHVRNRNNGMLYKSALLSGTQIKERIDAGETFVAINGGSVMGTASVNIKVGKDWYDRGHLVAHYCYDAVLPEYQGQGIMKSIDRARDVFSYSKGAEIIRSGTAEKNFIQRNKFKRQGFLPVDLLAIKDNNFYSVIYAKWLNKTIEPSILEIRFNYIIRVIRTKLLYRIGGKKGFCL